MRERDLGWAAGFFEAEGSLSLNLNNSSGFMGWVQAGQKCREPLDRLQELFGGVVRYARSSTQWQWVQNGKAATPFLEAILPIVAASRRKEEIEKYIEFYATQDRDARMRILCWWVGRIARYRKVCQEAFPS